MFGRLARWLGEWAVVAVATWLAWEQVNRFPQWSLYAVLGGIAFLALITLPIGKNEDGTTRRLVTVRGRPTQVSCRVTNRPSAVTSILEVRRTPSS